MNVYDVIFVNAKETLYNFHTVNDSAAVPTLLYYLREFGVANTTSFPPTEDQLNISVVREEFKKFLSHNYAPVFGISFWTNTHAFAMDFAQDIREAYPEALIVGGGPHYLSDEEIGVDLESRLIDLAFKGGAEPFFNFARSFFISKDISVEKKEKGLKITGNIPDSGLHYLSEDGAPVRKKSGKLGYPVCPLVTFTEKGADIRVLVTDICINQCDYCVIDNKKQDQQYLPLLYEWLEQIVRDVQEDYQGPIMFSLSDSAPFALFNRKKTKTFLDGLKKRWPDAEYNIFMDPSDIDDDFLECVERYNLSSFFMGRDRIVEDRIVGRRLKGAYRTQEQLDSEYESVKVFLKFLSERAKDIQQDVYIGYILSPFEKEQDSQRMIDEILEITSFTGKGGKLMAQANIFLLNPYPGSKVAEKLQGKYVPMRYFYHPIPNAWVSEDSNTIFLELARHIIVKLFCNLDTSGIYRPLLQLAHDIQFGRIFDWRLVEMIENRTMKDLARYVVEHVLAMELGKEKDLEAYFDNLLNLHYLGCMVPVVLKRPDLFKRKDLPDAIKAADMGAPLLKRDLEVLKRAAMEGKAPCLNKYL